MFQCRLHLGHRLKPLSWLLRKTPSHDVLDCRWRLERLWIVVQHSDQYLGDGRSAKCAAPRDHLTQDRAKAEDIGARIERPSFSLRRSS